MRYFFLLSLAVALSCGVEQRDAEPVERRARQETATPPLLTPAWSSEGDQTDANWGSSVASAGDVNGDGYSDVLVGGENYDDGELDEGRVALYLGSASGLGSTPSWNVYGNEATVLLGQSVASAGDVNGDGFSDVIVSGLSRLSVYLGSASGLATNAAWNVTQQNTYQASVASAGDVNGDGYSDVIVGMPHFTTVGGGLPANGGALVYLGSASGLATTHSWSIVGFQAGENLGRSVASAGDVNDDGFSDVIVGDPALTNPSFYEGRFHLYLGSATGLSPTPQITPESNLVGVFFGTSVAGAGDVNRDGFSDVVVGAPFYYNPTSGEGRAFGFRGSASGLEAFPSWGVDGDQLNVELGHSVASAGDVDSDGYADVVVGAWRYSDGEAEEGRVLVYRGSASGLQTTPSFVAHGNVANARFGHVVASAGDVNGDGFSDVLVGAPFHENGHVGEGKAYLYLGSCTGADTDGDLTCDAADGCPNDPGKTAPGICGCGVADTNTDGDVLPDCTDGCDEDPNKTASGICGCGIADTDGDSDATADCDDACPTNPGKIEAGVCGCNSSDADTDNDGTPNCNDDCPSDPNKTAPGSCGCGVAEGVCTDGCPSDPDKTAPGVCGCGIADADTDNDGTPNCNDSCPSDPSKTAPGFCGCGQADGDSDSDGTPNCTDSCSSDPEKTAAGICGCGTTDTDTDGDDTPDCVDGCSADPDKTAPGICGCGVEESTSDRDGDGTLDCLDRCAVEPAPTSDGCPSSGEGGAGGDTGAAGAGGEGNAGATGAAGETGQPGDAGAGARPATGGTGNDGGMLSGSGGEALVPSSGTATDDSGCGCRTVPTRTKFPAMDLAVGLLSSLILARRRRTLRVRLWRPRSDACSARRGFSPLGGIWRPDDSDFRRERCSSSRA